MRRHFYNIEKDYIIKLMELNNIVIDDRSNRPIHITGLIEFNNPNKPLAACTNNFCYPLNEIYILRDSNGRFKMHLSNISLGGKLYEAYPSEESITDYNSKCQTRSALIKCIHRPDGSKVYPYKK